MLMIRVDIYKGAGTQCDGTVTFQFAKVHAKEPEIQFGFRAHMLLAK